MSNFTIYNNESLEIDCNSDEIPNVLKFAGHKSQLFILSSKLELFRGIVEKKSINLSKIRHGIIDLELSNEILYVADENGCVYKIAISDIETELWTEIVVPNPKTCPHGYKSIAEKVRIARINCNADGILFTSFNHELYGMGNFSEVLQSEYPMKVECFSGLKILQVTTGDHFAVVLTSKRNDPGDSDYDSSSTNEELPDIFVGTECPKCPSRFHTKNISKSTTETSMASSPSDTFDSEENIRNHPDPFNANTTPAKSSKDSAINFFLESLSISSEDFIEAGKQTKILKENVTNITSMVYESVKTLSRHMSGSDNNDTPPMESFEIINGETSKSDFQECGIYMSDTSSIDEMEIHTEFGMEKTINYLCRIGNSLITTGVWSFGSTNRDGQLGTGDGVKRNIIIPVLKLQGQGVVKISSGRNHSVALTLDGRLFLWGSNTSRQVCNDIFDEYSAPKLFKNREKTLDAICPDKSTVVLLNNLNVQEEGKLLSKKPISTAFEIRKEVVDENKKLPNFLACGNYFIVNHSIFAPIGEYLTIEQKFLHEILSAYNSPIKPFLKKTSCIPHGQLYDNLCHAFLNVINFTALNVKSLKEYYLKHINCTQVTFLKNLNEMIILFRHYLKHFCNVLCINGFEHMTFTMENPVNSKIRGIFDNPFRRIWGYMDLIDELLKYENEFGAYLEDKKRLLDKFRIEKSLAIDEAERTLKFWKSADKIMMGELQDPERRLILDSKDITLKMLPAGPFSNQRFVLFSDYLCHYTSSLSKFPLTTLWVESIHDFESKKFNLKIITPEMNFVVMTRNHEDKIKWLEEISKHIKISLNKPLSSKVPISRNTSYEFSNKHPIYFGVKYFGMWSNGYMHGIGRLEFPDGRVYNGQMTNGEIQGFGQMFSPAHGTYEGNMENGKFHGFGILETKSKERYKGNFKNGEYSGHGKFENDRFEYVGEFSRNCKSGYGVLDDKFTGDKYLGLFEGNKKCGLGTVFTIEGDCFNGNFTDDILVGEGIALLIDGSYYKGELSIHGPAGKGTLYICSGKIESFNLEDFKQIKVTGHRVTGTFGGTWKHIKILNGGLSMDDEESENIEILNLNPDKKWCSLFSDWENEVFPETLQNYNSNSIWNKISVYISNSKRKEKFKSDGFEMKNQKNSINFDAASAGYINDKMSRRNPETDSLISTISNRSGQLAKRNNFDNKDRLPDIVSIKNISSCQKSISSEMLIDDNRKRLEFETEKKILCSGSIDNIPDRDCKFIKSKGNILENTPNFGLKDLLKEDVTQMKEYLFEAFKDMHHPLGVLLSKISKCFYFSYGHWNNQKPSILTSHALDELESISIRVYNILRKLFPALPEDSIIVDNEKISHRFFYSILLSNSIYSSLFVLYASKCSPLDEVCQRRIRFANKKSDEELLKFLKLEAKLLPLIKHNYFREAVQCFRNVETKFCPNEMLTEIKNSFQLIYKASYEVFADSFVLNTDYLLPLSIFLTLRSNIPHVGAELLLLEDLLESEYELNGESGACFTHIKASYGYITSNVFFED